MGQASMAARLSAAAALYAAGVGLCKSNPTYHAICSLTRRGGFRGLSLSLWGGNLGCKALTVEVGTKVRAPAMWVDGSPLCWLKLPLFWVPPSPQDRGGRGAEEGDYSITIFYSRSVQVLFLCFYTFWRLLVSQRFKSLIKKSLFILIVYSWSLADEVTWPTIWERVQYIIKTK